MGQIRYGDLDCIQCAFIHLSCHDDQGMLGVSISDLAFALLVLRNEKEPSFSLDPSDPGNPSGPTLRQVYMPDMLRSTNFGDIMFEADWKLKLLAFGLHSLALPQAETLARPNFHSIPLV